MFLHLPVAAAAEEKKEKDSFTLNSTPPSAVTVPMKTDASTKIIIHEKAGTFPSCKHFVKCPSTALDFMRCCF